MEKVFAVTCKSKERKQGPPPGMQGAAAVVCVCVCVYLGYTPMYRVVRTGGPALQACPLSCLGPKRWCPLCAKRYKAD